MDFSRLTTPEAAGLNLEAVAKLLERVQREIDDGLLPACHVALAKDGKVALFESFGAADESSLFCMFSATKGITSAAAWLLIQDGKLSVDERVVDIVPEFGTNGKKYLDINLVLCREQWDEVDDKTLEIVSNKKKYAWISSRPLSRLNVHTRCNLGARYRWGIEAGFKQGLFDAIDGL